MRESPRLTTCKLWSSTTGSCRMLTLRWCRHWHDLACRWWLRTLRQRGCHVNCQCCNQSCQQQLVVPLYNNNSYGVNFYSENINSSNSSVPPYQHNIFWFSTIDYCRHVNSYEAKCTNYSISITSGFLSLSPLSDASPFFAAFFLAASSFLSCCPFFQTAR